jgi:hypothetical protein
MWLQPNERRALHARKLAHLYKQSALCLQALAFWLNFYHCLLAHALLILGPPTTSRSALTFFNRYRDCP